MGSLRFRFRSEEQGARPTCPIDLSRDLGQIAEQFAVIGKGAVRDWYLVDFALPGTYEAGAMVQPRRAPVPGLFSRVDGLGKSLVVFFGLCSLGRRTPAPGFGRQGWKPSDSSAAMQGGAALKFLAQMESNSALFMAERPAICTEIAVSIGLLGRSSFIRRAGLDTVPLCLGGRPSRYWGDIGDGWRASGRAEKTGALAT